MGSKKYDWEAIEKDYRIKKYSSVRGLADAYPPITEGAIRKKAKGNPNKGVDPWEFDLVDDYQKGVQEQLVRSEPEDSTQCVPKNSQQIQSDKEIIKEAVDVGVRIVRGHRKKAEKLGFIFDELAGMVETSIVNKQLDPFLSESKGTHESVFDMTTKLSRVAESIVKLEREAYNLNIKEAPKDEQADDLEAKIKAKMEKNGFKFSDS